MNKRLKRGYIQVYTGNGKGKTTAALGLALRCWGHGLRVCVVQFMKKNTGYGEYKASLKLGRRFVIKQFGTNKFVKKPSPKDIRLAEKGLDFAKQVIMSGKYDLVILDEVNCVLKWKLIEGSEVRELLRNKPRGVELVLTGRYAPGWLVRQAHLVTEMKEKRHYFRNKVAARHGIEY